MFPEEKVAWGEERTLRIEGVFNSTEQISAISSWQHPHSDPQSNGSPLSKIQDMYSRRTVPHGPVWEFVSEQITFPIVRIFA